MKKSWIFIVASWTGLLIVFFSLCLSLVEMPDLGGGYTTFSSVLAKMANNTKIFPVGLYGAFLIILFVLSIISLGVLVMDEFKLLRIEPKIFKTVKLIVGATITFIGLLVFIFGICYTASINAAYSTSLSSSNIVAIGGSPFAAFIGSILCGGAYLGNVFLTKDKKSNDDIIIVDAEEV